MTSDVPTTTAAGDASRPRQDDADRGPVGLPTRKGATRTPSLPNARSSRASVGDDHLDHDVPERRHGARGDPATAPVAAHETPALRSLDEHDQEASAC